MTNNSSQPVGKRMKAVGRGKESISFKINMSILAVLIPSLVILIVTSCIMVSQAIAKLNTKVLDAQADYAVSIVDDFFSGKVAAVSMFEEDGRLQAYFGSVLSPEDIETYEKRDEILKILSSALDRMSEEEVMQVWAADVKTDSYLLSTGEVVKADLRDTGWYKKILESKEVVVSEPYQDPATKEEIVSVVAPVFSPDETEAEGYFGFDVYVSSLTKLLSGIKVGDNGYLELLSKKSDYIYSDDPDATGKNVSDLNISESYKEKILNRYNGIVDFHYNGIDYTSMFCNSEVTGWLAAATLPMSEVNATRDQLITVLVLLAFVILAVLIAVIVIIIRKMMRPLSEISDNMKEFSQGNLEVDIQIHSKDEIGLMADSVRASIQALKEMINDVSYLLGEISNGNLDLTVDGEYIGDFRFIRDALEKIISSLNLTMGQINVSAEQVSCGSEQVSAGAQALSQGASEQAGAVEELAVSISEISNQITSNAENAADANKQAYSVENEAVKSNLRMKEMLAAMKDISESSREIDKIIKVIEEIAFQTNLLALNAAVEAARAGESGRGFAVVAGEVRNLASKSAEASKNTTALIENSLKAVERGTKIADETAKSLETVVAGVKTVVGAIDGISEASSDQARSVEQVTQGIELISNVVQVNSATAEESAAASEEFSAQALLLKEWIGKFQLRKDSK